MWGRLSVPASPTRLPAVLRFAVTFGGFAGLAGAIALLVSAAVFGRVHAGNPGASWVSSLSIALESGVLLGLAYAATRSLWLPIGLHFGWNFTAGGIFGAAVSGGTIQWPHPCAPVGATADYRWRLRTGDAGL
jgi:membrane protease YdiL (CAAX protease family)